MSIFWFVSFVFFFVVNIHSHGVSTKFFQSEFNISNDLICNVFIGIVIQFSVYVYVCVKYIAND